MKGNQWKIVKLTGYPDFNKLKIQNIKKLIAFK